MGEPEAFRCTEIAAWPAIDVHLRPVTARRLRRALNKVPEFFDCEYRDYMDYDYAFLEPNTKKIAAE
jgi:hypothetical protein